MFRVGKNVEKLYNCTKIKVKILAQNFAYTLFKLFSDCNKGNLKNIKRYIFMYKYKHIFVW